MVHASAPPERPHQPAAARVKELAEGTQPWAVPWPCVHEFFSIATHPRVYDPPSTMAQACTQIGAKGAAPMEHCCRWGSTDGT